VDISGSENVTSSPLNQLTGTNYRTQLTHQKCHNAPNSIFKI